MTKKPVARNPLPSGVVDPAAPYIIVPLGGLEAPRSCRRPGISWSSGRSRLLLPVPRRSVRAPLPKPSAHAASRQKSCVECRRRRSPLGGMPLAGLALVRSPSSIAQLNARCMAVGSVKFGMPATLTCRSTSCGAFGGTDSLCAIGVGAG
jgi:hypothetical protein